MIDSPPGTGKSTAILSRENQTVNQSPTIYFVERISEIYRYTESCVHLETPAKDDNHSTLTESLLSLLKQGKSIATSHALLANMTAEHWYEVSKHNYKYVIDEAITEVRKVLEIRSKDIEKLVGDGYLVIEEKGEHSFVRVTQKEGYEEHQKLLSKIHTGQTKLLGDPSGEAKDCTYVLVWGIHPDTFLCASSIEVLTYQSEGSFLHKYLEMLKIDIKKKSIINGEIVPYVYQDGSRYRDLIVVHDGKQNDFAVTRGDKLDSGLTSTWYGSEHRKRNSPKLKKVRANVLSFFRSMGKDCTQETFAFTSPEKSKDSVTYSDFYNRTLHKKLDVSRGSNTSTLDYDFKKVTFLPQNIRGVNDFAHKQYMAYLCNTYPIQPLQAAFAQEGFAIDTDDYALNQLIQWVFRGAVRNGKPMTVFIPNRRMRRMFLKWLGYSDEELF